DPPFSPPLARNVRCTDAATGWLPPETWAMGRWLPTDHPGRWEANQTCGKLSFLRCTQKMVRCKSPFAAVAASAPLSWRIDLLSLRNRGRRAPFLSRGFDAAFALLPADPARGAARRGDRVPQTDAAGRHDPAGGGGHLCLPAARPPRADQGLPDRARGTESRRRRRDVDADHPVGGPVARERPL